jgi:hypothetical protein
VGGLRRDGMAEKAPNPVEQKSQKPDKQDKTTSERFEKQKIAEGDFTKGTITPDIKK